MSITLSTGTDDSNTLLPDGSIDFDYLLVGYGGAYVVNDGFFPLDGNWLADGPNSKWIGPSPSAFGSQFTVLDYQTTFDLTGIDPTTFQIIGAWATDNEGIDILINGQSTGNIIDPPDRAGFRSLTPFTITSGFLPGINTLDFLVHNDEGPTGLRVEIAPIIRGNPRPTPDSPDYTRDGILNWAFREAAKTFDPETQPTEFIRAARSFTQSARRNDSDESAPRDADYYLAGVMNGMGMGLAGDLALLIGYDVVLKGYAALYDEIGIALSLSGLPPIGTADLKQILEAIGNFSQPGQPISPFQFASRFIIQGVWEADGAWLAKALGAQAADPTLYERTSVTGTADIVVDGVPYHIISGPQLPQTGEDLFVFDKLDGHDLNLGAGNDVLLVMVHGQTVHAGDGNDTVILHGGANFVDAGAGSDLVIGGTGNDTLEGGQGDDILAGGLGNDGLDGGPGIDFAVFFGARADYTIESYRGSDGLLHTRVIDHGGSNDGADDLVNIEKLLFLDQTIAINTAPIAVDDENSATTGAGGAASGNVLANDADPDGDTLLVTGFTGGTYGTLVLAADGSYNYLVTNLVGPTGSHLHEIFTYTVNDGRDGVASANLDITLNRGPIAQNDGVGVSKGGTIVGNVRSNDFDPDGDAIEIAGIAGGELGRSVQGKYGTLTLNGDGTYSYVANKSALPSNFVAQDTFIYTATDSQGGIASAALSIVVLDPNQSYQAGGHTTLNGGNGKDVLDGSSGYNVVIGGNGQDVLIGGPGDILTGGNGPDTFLFRPNFGTNTVTDFDVNTDVIQFDKSIFQSVADVLDHTSSGATGAVISDGQGGTIALTGITLAQLQSHQADFHLV